MRDLDAESLLLLYAADELGAEDRGEVEQVLAGDAGLRAALAAVVTGTAAASAALAALDRADPAAASPSAEAVAPRRVGRAVRQWNVDRLVGRRVVPVPSRQPRFPTWAYPVGAVASVLLLVGVLARWGVKTDLVATEGHPVVETASAARARFIEDTFTGNPEASGELSDAETQGQLLAVVADDVPAGTRDSIQP